MEKLKRKKKGKWIGFITTLCIIIFLTLTAVNIWKIKNRKQPEVVNHKKIPVQICIVKRKKINDYMEVTGDFLPFQCVKIYPRIPGEIIEKIMVHRGDFVKKGQLIARLEKSRIKAQMDRAKAQVELAAANRDVLQKDFFRIKSLFKHKAASRQKLDHVSAELKAAEARVKEAKAAFKELKVIYKEHDIFATISGVVTDRYLDPGSFSNPVVPILRIAEEKRLKLLADVSESAFYKIKKGMKITFYTDACPGKIFSGKIFMIYPDLNPGTRTVKLEIHVPNDKLVLRPGMFAHVRVNPGEKTALAVPLDGLIKMSGTGSYYAFTIDHGKARLKNLKTGIIQNNSAEILSGLKQGDQLVIKGQRELKDGVSVKVVNRNKNNKISTDSINADSVKPDNNIKDSVSQNINITENNITENNITDNNITDNNITDKSSIGDGK